MKRSTVYVALAVIALVVAAVVELVALSYLNQRLALYRSQRAAIESDEQAYRRPLLDRNAVEQNAATLYAQALPNLSKLPLDALTAPLSAGAAQYDLSTEGLLAGACAEADSDRVRTALRSSYCNWQLGFGTASETRFEYPREGLTLALCMTIEGHRSAHQGSFGEAERHYLDGLAVGCDLGNGNETMLFASLKAITESLLSTGKLVTASNDALALRRLAGDLAEFEDHLPSGHTPLMRSVLWTQNEVALEELEAGFQSGGFGLIGMKRALAARALKNQETLFDDFTRVALISNRSEAPQVSDKVKSDLEHTPNEFVSLTDVRRSVNLALSAIEAREMYRAVLVAIELQQWRLENGSYPEHLATIGSELPVGLRYERSTVDPLRFKIIGPRTTLIER